MPLETRVLLKFDRFSGFISEFSSNVSQGGMFIRTRTAEPIGTVLDFGFRLGDDYELIHGRGEVVWVRTRDEAPERPAGMGIRFLELSAGSRELIRKMVDAYVQAGGTPFDVSQAPEPAPTPVHHPATPAVPAIAPVVPMAVPPAPEPPVAVQAEPQIPAEDEPPSWLEVEPTPPPAVPSPAFEPEEEVSFLSPAAAPTVTAPAVTAVATEPEPEAGPAVMHLPDFDLDSDPDPDFNLDPDFSLDPEPPPAPAPANVPTADLADFQPKPDPVREPEPRTERTPLPWPVVAAGEPVPPASEPLAPPSPSHRIDLSPRTAPPVFQAAAAPSAGRGKGLVLGGAAAAVVLLIAALFLARGPLRGFLRLPGTSSDATQAVAPPPERPTEPTSPASPASGMPEPSPERAGTAATPPPRPSPSPSPATSPTPAPSEELAASQSPPPFPPPAAVSPVPTPPARAAEEVTPAASSTFTAVERITWEQNGGATEIVLWGNGAIRRANYQQVRVGGDPPREVVKLIGIQQPFSQGRLEVGTRQVRQLRIGFHEKPGADELHVVIDLANPDARVTGIQEETGRLRVRIQ